MISLVLGWLVRNRTILLVAAGLIAGWLSVMAVYTAGQRAARAECQAQRDRDAAEAAARARAAEQDVTIITRDSATRIADKERMLNEQAHIHAEQIRKILASVPECRIPRGVGRVLDRAAGTVPEPPAVAQPPAADPDDPALDQLVRLADELDTVRENYGICRANADRLTEARDWYEALRARVNRQ